MLYFRPINLLHGAQLLSSLKTIHTSLQLTSWACAAQAQRVSHTARKNGGQRPPTHSTFSQVHTCRGIWAASAHVAALPQPRGVQTCSAAFLLPALVPDPPPGGPRKTLCRGVRDGC